MVAAVVVSTTTKVDGRCARRVEVRNPDGEATVNSSKSASWSLQPPLARSGSRARFFLCARYVRKDHAAR